MRNDSALVNNINGNIPHRLWYVTTPLGDQITQNDTNIIESMSRLDIFLLMFPPQQLQHIINLTNTNLRKEGQRDTTKGEIVKFFGIIILGTRFEFRARRDLWNTTSKSEFIDPPRFGQKTGMGRERFDHLWSAIRFSDQPAEREPDEDSSVYRWKLVDDFVKHFNEYRAGTYSPSDCLCVDESICRWYGLGGSWINIGLLN